MKAFGPDYLPAPFPPIDGEVHSDEEIEYAIEEGLMGRIEARELSGMIAVKSEGEAVSAKVSPAATSKRQLELVANAHAPQAGVERHVRLRKPRKARTWQEKQAADQAPVGQRPPEWDESRR